MNHVPGALLKTQLLGIRTVQRCTTVQRLPTGISQTPPFFDCFLMIFCLGMPLSRTRQILVIIRIIFWIRNPDKISHLECMLPDRGRCQGMRSPNAIMLLN